MNLSKNFTLEEMTRSDYATRHGIDNTASPIVVANLKILCEDVLQPLRDAVDAPIIVTSGYRSLPVNRGVGSSDKSQHVKGEAADFRIVGTTSKETFKRIVQLNLPFDQLIDEFESWIHVSHTASRTNRKQKLLARHDAEGQVVYHLVDLGGA